MIRIYLASPYSGTETQQIERYKQVCQSAADIIRMGYAVFSPIAHSHGIAVHGGLNGDHSTWKDQNLAWLEWCNEVWVVNMPGWDESKGVGWEMKMAKSMGKPVRMF